MHGLFFEVKPKPGHMAAYFAHVDRLKPVLAQHRGLLFLERYRPLDDAEALLSHQLWQDEAAIAAWRGEATHRASQSAGRTVHFEGYRIRVGLELSDPEGAARLLLAAYGPAPLELPGGRAHESVTNPGSFLTLAVPQDAETARDMAADARGAGADRLRLFRVDRDYTLTARAEAPPR
jgi:heme-degrading monooxygenase HmoA